MRKIFTFGSMLVLALAGELHAAPLDNLTNDQKSALGQLFGGYSESFLCNKQVDFDVAAAFLKSKLGSDTLSVKQAANLAHFAIGIQIIAVSHLELGKMQKEAAQNAVKEHCMRVEQAFGPKGNVIPGLLKY